MATGQACRPRGKLTGDKAMKQIQECAGYDFEEEGESNINVGVGNEECVSDLAING